MNYFTVLLSFFIASTLVAQTNHQVDAQATTWSPSDITIDVGDSVTWINNNSGTHNINGTTATFAANPESFGDLTTSGNWVYGKRFNIPGVYQYRCDVHAAMMLGQVTVVAPSAGIGTTKLSTLSISPNPARDIIRIKSGSSKNDVIIYDILGNKVMSVTLENQTQIDISGLNSGVYMVEIYSTEGYAKVKFIKR